MSGRFEFSVEARGGDADLALRRLLELLRSTAESGLRDLDGNRPTAEPEHAQCKGRER